MNLANRLMQLKTTFHIGKMSPLEYHTIAEAIEPSADTEAWAAYIILSHLNPNMTYLSYDGYHCHGIADHVMGIQWQSNWIMDKRADTKLTLSVHFEDLTTHQIVTQWNDFYSQMQRMYFG